MITAPATTETAKANGETRTIYLHHAHTKESIAATYMVNGQYEGAVLDKLNWFLRDWRRDEATKMDPRLFDTVWEVYRESGSQQPIEVMSAYRSAETNAMLRRRSRTVAEHSQHILGKAMDQHYVDVPMSRIREIAMKLQRGGVGFYPTAGSPFVHMDVGGVRHWPRMSYDQLARLFPDGKTVHIPSNGQPLPGYEEARAELEARGDGFDYPTASQVKSKGLFAWLFGGGEDDDEAAATSAAHDRRPGPRMASLDPRAAGGPSDASFAPTSSKNGGAQAFNMAQAAPSFPAASPAEQRRAAMQSLRLAQAEEAQRAQALADQQKQVALAEQQRRQQEAAAEQQRQQQEAQAQQALAQAMAAEQKARAEAEAKAASGPVVAAQDSPAAIAPLVQPQRIAAATQALAGGDATSAPDVPLPPRRPIELAAAGPLTPLPPDRPTELASLVPPAADLAQAPAAPQQRDAIAALMAGPQVAGRAVNLPSAILQGSALQNPIGLRGVPPLPPVMAYAAPVPAAVPLPPAAPVPAAAPLPPVAPHPAEAPIAAAPPRIAVPLPVARPAQFVAARLDRSNFRALTSSGTTNRMTARTSLGSAVSALRPAAQSNLGILVGEASAGAARAFAATATDLATDHFAGPAIKAIDPIATSSVTGPSGDGPSTE